MIPQKIDPLADQVAVCEFSIKWRVSLELATKIHHLARVLQQQLQIVSGYRTAAEQGALSDGAPVDVSTHTSCPATGADLQVIGWNKTNAPPLVKRAFGGASEAVGLRWGGGSKRYDGIPVDWNHVDLGPRSQQ